MKIKNVYMICLVMALFSLFPFSSSAFAGDAAQDRASDIESGKRIYTTACILCHGSKGQGDGPASVFIGPYSHPRPNDFTRGVFKYRTTESGDLPTLTDLMRTIRYGIPGYMPSFKHLTEEGIRQVALYVSTTFVEDELSTEPMEALNSVKENVVTVKKEETVPTPKPADDRIEVYKGITVVLNNIAQNSLTAIAQKEDSKPALKAYAEIVTVLNTMVSNLETKPGQLPTKEVVAQNIAPAVIAPLNHFDALDNNAISLEEEGGQDAPLMVASLVEPNVIENNKAAKKILSTDQRGPSQSTFSNLFIAGDELL